MLTFVSKHVTYAANNSNKQKIINSIICNLKEKCIVICILYPINTCKYINNKIKLY